LERHKTSSPVSSTPSGSQSNVPPFEQLVLIGATVIQFGISNWLIDYYPNDSMRNLTELGRLTNGKPSSWGKLYRLRSLCSASSVSYAQTSLPSPLPSPSAPGMVPRSNGELFRAYVGALFLENGGEKGGLSTTNRWIQKILEHEVKQGTMETTPEDDESSGMSYISPLPSPISQATARVTSSPSNGNTANALSMLNELAIKHKKEISWNATSKGQSHEPTWIMELSISGYGTKYKATHTLKKTAQNLAAESALKDRHLVSFLKA